MRSARRPQSRLGAGIALLAVALTASVSVAGAQSEWKPVVGKPLTAPVQAVAGKRFTASFKVTRSDTGAALTQGILTTAVTAAQTKISHTKSFRAGTAKVSFVVPAIAQGKSVRVKLTIRAPGASAATKVAVFPVRGAPTVSIADASGVEGSSGTTTLSFAVTLSTPSSQTVTVNYATADGTATQPADYTAASGALTFAPGEKSKAVSVPVVADLDIEQDETFSVALSGPVNATIAKGSATGTISNDDTAVPITAGDYKGATQEGNYVFFLLRSDRTITQFRINDLPASCSPPTLRLTGGENFGDSVFRVRDDGTFVAEGSWTGSEVDGKAEWTSWSVKITGAFGTPTSVTGTITENWGLKYEGAPYTCTTGEKKWSATRQG